MTERKKLLQKLHSGFFTKKDLEKLLELIHENPQDNNDEVMRNIWDNLRSYDQLEPSQSETILKRTKKLLEMEEAIRPVAKITTHRKFQRLELGRNILRSTAAAVVLFVIGAFAFNMYNNQQVTTVSTQYGEQLEISLPDHSTVKLNSNSSLTFRKNWDNQESRQVSLKGEAYFTVKKNLQVEQKFEVLTKDLKVQVLGTVFNVNAREQMTTVFLEEGKVNLDLENIDKEIAMKPGELISYSRATRISKKKQIAEATAASWRNGTMEFRDSSLADILNSLKDVYGIEVVYNNRTSLDRRYRISLPVASWEMAFQVLKEVTRLDLVNEDNKIIVN